MSDHARNQVLSYLDAVNARDIPRALTFVDDDVDFMAHMPVQLFPHLGRRRGKAAIEQSLRTVQQRYASTRHEVAFLAAEGDKVAVILQIHLEKSGNGRVVRFPVAEFFTLRNGLIIEHRQFMDSFDLVQQVLEREIIDELAPSESEPISLVG